MKRQTKRLRISTETIRQLSARETALVVGGAPVDTYTYACSVVCTRDFACATSTGCGPIEL